MTPPHRGTTTVDRTIVRGAVKGEGSKQQYHGLEYAPGEEIATREDLAAKRGSSSRSIAYIAHLTDIQLLDTQSPARLDFMHQYSEDPATGLLLPAQRPQELLVAHAADALVRAIDELRTSPLSGAPLQLMLTTGDMIDNMQWNELQSYLTIFSGGVVAMNSGGTDYEGAQSGQFDWAWAPESGSSAWGEKHGYPRVPGLVAAALRNFASNGLDVPWLTCNGNHDGLVQGRSAISPELAGIMTGSQRSFAAPPGPFGDFVSDPGHLFSRPSATVTPDAGRRPATRQDFVEAHFHDGSLPIGHGFTQQNVETGTAYFAYDGISGVRVIVLDTTNPAGNFEGSLDRPQFEWLGRMLAEVHHGEDENNAAAISEERLVIVASHHPRTSMTNATTAPGSETQERILGNAVGELLDSYPNVVAWISGHTHKHSVLAHPSSGGGYWEITTASVMEWPGQIRMLEIFENDDDSISLVSTVVDHSGDVEPGGLNSTTEIASWHRELSSNDPTSVGGPGARGTAQDRNVELVMPDPRKRLR